MTADEVRRELEEGKGGEIVILPAAVQSGGLFTHMVVATAGSARHAAALAERVLKAQKQGGNKQSRVETSAEREWVLIDCGDVVVHIMQAPARDKYRLEDLWGFDAAG